jgi:deazaflavin-dependent oxidoreductase (nitroreductase family)
LPETQGRYVYRSAGPVRRLIRRWAASRLGSWILARSLDHLDRAVFSITRGGRTLTGLLAGVPTVMLTTRGARTGRKSTVPVFAVYDGDQMAVIASNYGRPRHPGWYHNLLENPEAIVSVGGVERPVTARLTAGVERSRFWELGTEIYPGWNGYERRARGRVIGIFVLQDTERPAAGNEVKK